ncbi:tRNA-specific 2-thiouridylase [Infundibulicybe gibba]|nr:tRNA-specific 2-thiouridylase [Infundibulicybe gibba]
MSGGVDSSVTAHLLAKEDFDLSAVFMRNWDTRDETGTDKGCEWEKDWEDVQRVCKLLDIPCEMIDLSRDYWNRVFEPSLKSWELGVTPNPDVWCNREIKFGALLERLPERPWFATAKDRNKDQSYYLSSISEAGLRRALFPLGHLSKPEVRELAKQARLPTAERVESMGICFVGEKNKFSKFISSYIPPNPGPMIDLESGRTLGQHTGLWNYTIGEKARLGGMPSKMFVAKKDVDANTIFLVPGTIHLEEFTWIWKDRPPLELDDKNGFHATSSFVTAWLMYPLDLTIIHRSKKGGISIRFDEPQKSVAPGQVAALWDDEWCLGCGVITSTS